MENTRIAIEKLLLQGRKLNIIFYSTNKDLVQSVSDDYGIQSVYVPNREGRIESSLFVDPVSSETGSTNGGNDGEINERENDTPLQGLPCL